MKKALACFYAISTMLIIRAQDVPLFENGEAQIVDAFSDPADWIRHELWIETEFDSDGDGALDRVHVAIIRPEQTESQQLRVAAIYSTSPYYSGTSGGDENMWYVRHEIGATPPPRLRQPPPVRNTRPSISNRRVDIWVPRGFAMVFSESPGTGLSQGCPTVGAMNESLAPKAVIEWLNGRDNGFTSVEGNEKVRADWCTGKVGMIGTSYNGTLPLAAATTGVKGLEAIISDAPNTSYWHYYRANGLVRSPGGYLGEDIDVLYDVIHSQESNRRAWCDENVRDLEMMQNMDRISGDYNEFWRGRDYIHQLESVSAAVFLSHGLSDWNVMPDHSIRIYEALRAKEKTVKLYLHQGGHGGTPPLHMQNRWFSHYLYEVDNGVEKEETFWIVREEDNRDMPTPYAQFPNPGVQKVTFYATGNGTRQGGLSTKREPWQGLQVIEDNVSFPGKALAQAEWTDHRLMFVTEELTESVHLSGRPVVHIRASSDKPAVNLSAWLVALPWIDDAGASKGGVITRGWADLQNHASLEESKPLIPGEFYRMSFEMEPDDQVIPTGHRIGLMVFCSDKEFTLHPAPGTKLTVDVDALQIDLPLVGGYSNH